MAAATGSLIAVLAALCQMRLGSGFARIARIKKAIRHTEAFKNKKMA